MLRATLIISGVLLAGLGMIVWTAPDWLVDRIARHVPGCLYRVRTTERVLALTLDDGPDPVSTPLILAELQRHDARATFFLISGKATTQAPLVRSIVAQRHELGNHFSHETPSIRLRPDQFEADLLRAHRALVPFGHLTWARPASGWYTRSMVKAMRRHGYRCALGSVYPFDAAIPSAVWASSYILRNARPGAVVILHDGGARGLRTARVLARVLPQLRKRGYRIVPLTDLVAFSQ